MKTNNNIPSYRFQGFEDDWEEVKLGEVLVEYNKKSEIENQFELLSSTNSGIEPRSGRVSGESNIGYKIIKRGMVVLSPQNLWLGNINYNAKFEIGIVSPSYKVFNINGPNELYLATVLRLPKMFFEYAQASVQGASIVRRNLDLDLFGSILVQLPSFPEQEAIGTFFSTLDRHITLHQRKLDTLKEQKKTYLKLLFPAKGQTKPALRFRGFEDDWEEVKLGEVLVEYNKKSEIENQFELLSSTNSGIEPRSGRVSGESNIGYKIIKRGMVVLSPQNLWLGNINYNAKFEIGIVSPSYKVFNIYGPNELFLATVLRLPQMFFEYAQASVQGASIVRRNLDLDLFGSILVPLPTLPEQEVIGSFFSTLDQEIAQVEDKLASLKEMKKTLLRKLFV
ncbi:restriction endonuclease subunit S [Streptococcus suis]|uniref:restriction endonuclease subunit S n=2 Tax=Streptococcus suis TaxID=1307 RepID=UPI000CF526FA|nr:restriction endonuclease subunit S [Streptococcus suis]